jgi:putative transposase
VDESQAIVLEDLNVAGMLRNHCLALSLADAGLGELHRQIQYKAEGDGKLVLEVGRFYASSKTCSACGAVNHGLTLKDRKWVCTACGTLHDRDENAATNLENQGIAGYARTCGLAPTQRLPSSRKTWGTGQVERNLPARDLASRPGAIPVQVGSVKQATIQTQASNGYGC